MIANAPRQASALIWTPYRNTRKSSVWITRIRHGLSPCAARWTPKSAGSCSHGVYIDTLQPYFNIFSVVLLGGDRDKRAEVSSRPTAHARDNSFRANIQLHTCEFFSVQLFRELRDFLPGTIWCWRAIVKPLGYAGVVTKAAPVSAADFG